MNKLVLVRHGESEWNKLNLFTGWTDVVLSEKGHEEAKAAGKFLKEEGYDFDENFNAVNHYYLGDQEALMAKIEAVANQGKAK